MIKPEAWDGAAEQFWDAIAAVRGDRETEGELAVLVDVLTLARALAESIRKEREDGQP